MKMNIPLKMKAWQLHGLGIENLRLENIDVPLPRPHEVLIKVSAVSLNYRDKAIIEGRLGAVTLPLTPVADAAGQVVAIGSEVSGFKLGDRVLSHLWSRWIDGEVGPEDHKYQLGSDLHGGLSEYMILEAQGIVRIPDLFTYEEASTFPTAGVAAWFALVNYGNLQAGESVLIQGTGGVSIFGLQIAHILGAKTIVTTSDDSKGEKIKEIGADHVINYFDTPEWAEETLRLTHGKGVDQVLEVVGGNGLNESVKAIKRYGQISIIGFLDGYTSNLDLIGLMYKQVKLQGIAMGHLKALESLINAFSEKNVKPIIEQVYPFDKAIEAYGHLFKGSLGKVVIKIA
jgi:NADPH:quinone reductase-like Zn-dependent oxidoreductase